MTAAERNKNRILYDRETTTRWFLYFLNLIGIKNHLLISEDDASKYIYLNDIVMSKIYVKKVNKILRLKPESIDT